MKARSISLNLADILRDRIDDCATFKRNAEVAREVLAAYLDGKPLSEEETKEAEACLYGRFLKLFLNSKEGLIIPDDATHRVASELAKDLDHMGIRLAYEDFYAYQFVDGLDDIVRRAFKVRDMFAKGRPPESVTQICREAYQSYLHGYHTASVALIRSIVESTLKDRLSIEIGELWKLNDLALARSLYPKGIWHKIDKVRDEANTFIHEVSRGKIPSEDKNLKLLGLGQEILQALIPLKSTE